MSKIKLKKFYLIDLLIFLTIFLIQNYNCVNGKECDSIFVRGDITDLSTLENCTVVKGNIIISLIKWRFNQSLYQFPQLREVTEFVLIFDVKGIETFSKMFPNLAIIRGEKLFENYALGIFEMRDLTELGFKSLLSIPKGHVFIDRCPKLCNAHMINWDIMTRSYGTNHIQKLYLQNCPDCAEYCSNKYCWGPHMCQLSNTTNLADLSQNTGHCHNQCLLGCSNISDMDCVVCKNFKDNEKCVQSCPREKYTNFDDKRCYNETGCIAMRRLIFEDSNNFRECVQHCPYGYSTSEEYDEKICEKCSSIYECSNIACPGGEIQYLQDAQYYKGCKIINGSLEIKMDARISQKLLETYLGDIQIITHYLKIYNMPHINTLQFLNNLERIHGEGLSNELFGLLIYDNHNLTKLWTTRKKVNIVNGGIYIHSNDKLCNREIVELQENLDYDRAKSHITFNEEEIYCSVPSIFVNCSVLSHNTVQIIWKNREILKNTEVFYREVQDKDLTIHNSSNETIGFKFIWKREKLPKNQYFDNEKIFLTYNLTNLKQNTNYELLIKTFAEVTENQLPERQSRICLFKTKIDFPQPPTMKLNNKTTNSITLEWDPNEYDTQLITNYIIEIYKKIDNQTYFDTRNYCHNYYHQYSINPPKIKFDHPNDYCTYEKALEQIENDNFHISINEKFKCSDENLLNCNQNDIIKNQYIYNYLPNIENDITLEKTINLQYNETKILIPNLKHYTHYIFKLYGCNKKGCGSYSLYHERTLRSTVADNIDYIIVEKSSKNPNECYIIFYQPKLTNGVIVAYQILLRRELSEQDTNDYNKENPDRQIEYDLKNSTVICITRLQHEKNNYKFKITLDKNGYNFTIRAVSLGGFGRTTDWRSLEMTIVETENESYLSTTATVFVTILCSVIFSISMYFFINYIRCKCVAPKLPRIRYRAAQNDVLFEDFSEENQRLA